MDIFSSFYDSVYNKELVFIVGAILAIIIGSINAFFYSKNAIYTKSFLLSIVTYPLLISTIIFFVNGNLGTAFALGGSFSMVRYRSAAATSQEMLSIFKSSVIGLIIGTGYFTLAIFATFILNLIDFAVKNIKFEDHQYKYRYLEVDLPKETKYSSVQFLLESTSIINKIELESYKTTDKNTIVKYLILLNSEYTETQLFNYLNENHIKFTYGKTKIKKNIL